MIVYMDRASIESLTVKDIREIVVKQSYQMKYQKLERYYVGDHDILHSERTDKTGGDNRIVNNMARYITDTATGYFLGQPVVYSSENEEYLQTIQDIFDYNDEQDHNTELGKQCSIKGDCFEMVYLDEDGRIRLGLVFPENLILFYETESEFTSPLAAIRMVRGMDKNGNILLRVEFWTWTRVIYLQSFNGGVLEVTGWKEHYWNDVPFCEYVNNRERIGDFEGVLSEIDAYNRVQSNTANYFQYNDDAILKVTRLGDVDSKDIAQMKRERAVILEDGGDVGWILKTVDDTALENYKNRLREDIHLGANVPNMTDEAFGGNLSGVAVSYKLWGLEQICAIKERKFKRALQRRIELITHVLNLLGHNYDYGTLICSSGVISRRTFWSSHKSSETCPACCPRRRYCNSCPLWTIRRRNWKSWRRRNRKGWNPLGCTRTWPGLSRPVKPDWRERLSRKRRLRKDEPAAAQCMD